MSKNKIEMISNSLQIDPDYLGPISTVSFYICDTEADLPDPGWGKFAVVKTPDEQGKYSFYVGTSEGWRKGKLKELG